MTHDEQDQFYELQHKRNLLEIDLTFAKSITLIFFFSTVVFGTFYGLVAFEINQINDTFDAGCESACQRIGQEMMNHSHNLCVCSTTVNHFDVGACYVENK